MRILVVFVEPMLYVMDLIHEVYEKTSYQFQYIFCYRGLTGRDDITLPPDSLLCHGEKRQHKSQIKVVCQSFQPDFVIINGYVGAEQEFTIRYCQKKKIPYAIESDTPLRIPNNKVKACLKKWILKKRLHNKFCYGFPGGTLQKENLVFYGIPEERNYIMPMSVSECRFLNAEKKLPSKEELKHKYDLEGKKIFLFVGRLVKEKRVGLLITAYEEVKRKVNDIALLIVGDGAERENLFDLVETHHINDVIFVGYRTFPKMAEYYKMADVFVLPSSYEPWGLVVNEAMIMGLPVIVSDKVGCRVDLVVDEENGYIFESDNCLDLATKMNKILQFEVKNFTVSKWNFEMYSLNFIHGVQEICKEQ